jgi:hypothetical protein
MNKELIYKGLIEKTLSADELALEAFRDEDLIPILLNGMQESPASLKYGCQKALRKLVDKEPAVLRQSFDLWVEMLEHKENIFQWQALHMIAGLASVVSNEQMEKVLDPYFARVTGPVMITANNAIKGSVLIVKARPDLAKIVLRHILRSERGSYESQTCYEIVMGHAMKAFYKMRKWAEQPQVLYEFAKRHNAYSHPVPRSSSKKLIERMQKDFSFG